MHVAAGGRSQFVVRIQQLLLMAREQFILQLVIYTALARMPWPRLGEGGDRGINVPALPRCLGRRQNKEAIVRPTLSQRNPEPFQSQFALTMSSLFRDLYSIEADMLFEAKNNCSMTSKNALGCQCQGQAGREELDPLH